MSRTVSRECLNCSREFAAPVSKLRIGQGNFCSLPCARKMQNPPRDPRELFWSKVDKAGPLAPGGLGRCWTWLGCKDEEGRGTAYIRRAKHKAPRVAFLFSRGRWPEPCALHHCDNPSCVRPEHLYEGTQADNVADRVARGRSAPKHGSHNGRAVLTEATARDALRRYRAGEPADRVAASLGVCLATIRHLSTGRTWKHIHA